MWCAAATNNFCCFCVSFCADILADGKEMSFRVAWDVCSSTPTKCVQFFLIKPLISCPLTIFAWKTVVATGNHDLPVNPFVWSWLIQDWVLLLFLYILIPSESSKQEAWKPLYTKAVPEVYFFFIVLAQRSISSIILIRKEAQLNSFSLQFDERTFSFS